MSELFIKHLNNLADIEPDSEFRARTRALILSTPRFDVRPGRVTIWQLFRLPRFAFSVTALIFAVLLVGFLGFQSLPNTVVTVSALETSNIAKELESLSIDVKLAQVSYNQKIEETVALAVSEISTRNVQQVGPILRTENDAIPTDLLERNQKIDTLLQDVLF